MDRISINNLLLQNQSPDSPAIITIHKSLTYKELKEVSLKWKFYFMEKGIAENDLVGIFCYHSVEFVVSILALWQLEAIPVLINPSVTQSDLKELLQITNSKKLVAPDKLINKFDLNEYNIITRPKVLIDDFAVVDKNSINPERTAAIIFTSGSSGKPKGVKLSYNSYYKSALIGNTILKHSSKDRWLASLPFYHVGGFSIVTRSLLFGIPLIIPPSIKTDDLVKSFTEFNPTICSLVSTQLKRLVDKKVKPNHQFNNVLLGGGFISSELVENARKLGWKITKVYGSTETASFITSLSPNEFKQKPDSVGKPLKDVKIKITDENGNTVKNNQSGEISISSPSLMQGYLNDKNITSKYFHSNDIGFIDDDGYIFLVGRKSDIIISGGENINSFEIENEILAHPAINETQVFPLKSDEWGEIVCSAIVVKKEAGNFNVEDLKSYLKKKLSGFKIPKKFFIVKEIPKTELGKVEKKILIEKYSSTNL